MRSCFLENVLVGQDIFRNSTPEELEKFIAFVDKNGPFDIVLDGLNIAFMSGTAVLPEVLVGLVSSQFLFSILQKQVPVFQFMNNFHVPQRNCINQKSDFSEEVS